MSVRVWIDTAGKARVIAREGKARGPGHVFDVQAKGADEAKRLVARALGDEPNNGAGLSGPDRRRARSAWLDWDDARQRVQRRPEAEVTS